jgi:DMSO/TMAO reductase YedYZ molybdopterin-dependent catalytic subunit
MKIKRLLVSSILTVVVMAMGFVLPACGGSTTSSQPGGEVEATEYQGAELTPISDQRNNALGGTQAIDKDSYRLVVDGLVDEPLSLSYADLQSYEQKSWLMDLNCVEGWSFTAKWTGPSLGDIFDEAGVKPDAVIAIFYTADVPTGYTSLDVEYIRQNDILLALKLNDVTLPTDRGFPLQVVAKSKYGYKWAKWVTRIELSSDADFRGYWESRGYNNDATVGGPAF